MIHVSRAVRSPNPTPTPRPPATSRAWTSRRRSSSSTGARAAASRSSIGPGPARGPRWSPPAAGATSRARPGDFPTRTPSPTTASPTPPRITGTSRTRAPRTRACGSASTSERATRTTTAGRMATTSRMWQCTSRFLHGNQESPLPAGQRGHMPDPLRPGRLRAPGKPRLTGPSTRTASSVPEIQILESPSEQALEDFQNDPRRTDLSEIRSAVVASTTVIRVESTTTA